MNDLVTSPSPKGAAPEKRSSLSGWSLLVLGLWVVACFSAAALGAISPPGQWYQSLRKPSWNPPSWVFGPVWTYLYLSMAVAAWRVWQHGGWGRQRSALGWFCAQLALNAAWSPIFFGLKAPGWAVLEILLLWSAIAWTLRWFRRVDHIAAWLLWPYLAWVSFATFLNATLWWMNRG